MMVIVEPWYNVVIRGILNYFIFYESDPVDTQQAALMVLLKHIFIFRTRTTAAMQWALEEVDWGGGLIRAASSIYITQCQRTMATSRDAERKSDGEERFLRALVGITIHFIRAILFGAFTFRKISQGVERGGRGVGRGLLINKDSWEHQWNGRF